MPKVSRCSHHCYHNIDVNLMLYEYSRFAGHPIFLTSFSFDLPKAFFQYSFFICILLPIISNILVCAILLTYSAITSGDKTCVTFCLDIAVVSLTLNIMWISVSIICVRYERSSLSLLRWSLLLCTQLLVALASAYSICLVYLFLLCHLGNVKYQN